jgi:hypothetical protein
MNKSEKDTQLKLMCLKLATDIELQVDVEVKLERIFLRANDMYNQACKWGYMDIVSPYSKPVEDINLILKRKLGAEDVPKKPTESEKELKKLEKDKSYKKKVTQVPPPEKYVPEPSPVLTPTDGPIPEGFKACPGCGEWIPVTWMKHAYKKDGTRCGHNI